MFLETLNGRASRFCIKFSKGGKMHRYKERYLYFSPLYSWLRPVLIALLPPLVLLGDISSLCGE